MPERHRDIGNPTKRGMRGKTKELQYSRSQPGTQTSRNRLRRPAEQLLKARILGAQFVMTMREKPGPQYHRLETPVKMVGLVLQKTFSDARENRLRCVQYCKH